MYILSGPNVLTYSSEGWEKQLHPAKNCKKYKSDIVFNCTIELTFHGTLSKTVKVGVSVFGRNVGRGLYEVSGYVYYFKGCDSNFDSNFDSKLLVMIDIVFKRSRVIILVHMV